MITSTEDNGYPFRDKVIYHIITEAEGLSATPLCNITPYYQKDANIGTASWTQATSAVISTAGTVRTYFNGIITYKRIRWKFKLFMQNSTDTPRLLKYEIHGHMKPERNAIHDATFIIDPADEKPSTIKSFLQGGRTSTALISWKDVRVDTSTTNVIMITEPELIELAETKGREPALAIRCRFQEVDYA